MKDLKKNNRKEYTGRVTGYTQEEKGDRPREDETKTDKKSGEDKRDFR